MHHRRFQRCRALVLEQRWEFMHAQSEGLLLHQCLTQRHVDATLDLADDQHRVDGSTDVMRDPYFGHPDLTGLYVDIDLHHRR